MSTSFSLTYPQPPTSPSPTSTTSRSPSETLPHIQSIHRPLKRTYAFCLMPDPIMDQPTAAESSIVPKQPTELYTAYPLPSTRRTRRKRVKGLPPTRSSQRILKIKEMLQRQLEPKEKEPQHAKRRKI
ncbi:hypothetical protein FRC03_002598 [Tulasnella sp. 419]|nr:hypothetical protein FRC03_002598 [Tulasnella sp. 419]